MTGAHAEQHGAPAPVHDRRIPGSRANIDHIAVAATGVWVIDTKNATGALPADRAAALAGALAERFAIAWQPASNQNG